MPPGLGAEVAPLTHSKIHSPPREGVSAIKQAEPSKVKRMNLNVEVELHNRFKASTAAQGLNMTDVLLEFIQNYVAKNSPATKKPKGRRG